jgi:hypothetical protein
MTSGRGLKRTRRSRAPTQCTRAARGAAPTRCIGSIQSSIQPSMQSSTQSSAKGITVPTRTSLVNPKRGARVGLSLQGRDSWAAVHFPAYALLG